MFSFFKRRKAQKEQEKQVAADLPEVVVPETLVEPATPPTHTLDSADSVTKLEPVDAEINTRDQLIEQADLTIRDNIFVETKRPAATPAPEPVVTPVVELAPAPVVEDLINEPTNSVLTEKIVPEMQAPSLASRSEFKSVVEPVPVQEYEDTQEDLAVASPKPSSTQEKPTKGNWLSRLRTGLSRTGQSFTSLFVGVKVDEDLFEELETALIMADAGVEATESLLTALRATVRKEKLTDAEQVKKALRKALTEHLRPLEKKFELKTASPLVVMIAGVNGAGKTTSIGKLAHAFQQQGASVLLAAGDTFRAAAREQLVEWGNRNNVQVIAQEGGNPGAVAFNAVTAGKSRAADVVMVDTAGRLPTQLHLMEELKKVKRAISKAETSAPHECLLVVDGNTGQNALAQIKAFDAAVGLTGLVVTKLDGTAKGGILAAVAAGSNGVRPIPVYWIGVGEGMHDLQPFVASEFAGALLGD